MDLIESIRKIKELPSDTHWFCPRTSSQDTGLYLLEDLHDVSARSSQQDSEARELKVLQASSRRDLAFECLKIFAYEGDDARPYQLVIEEKLRQQLSQCEICAREYHRGRRLLKEDLQKLHEEEQVQNFLQRLDDLNLSRIKSGLDEAAKSLRDAPEAQRGIRCLGPVALYAIFETLNCEPALTDEAFLAQHFDEPFTLIQTHRRLKLNTYTPAMTYFLFQKQSDRRMWAQASWAKFRRNITATEFEWNVEQPLRVAMTRVQLSCLDKDFLPLFWEGIRLICNRLSTDLVKHSLDPMDSNICKLALDHLQIDGDSFCDLLVAVDRILRLSPEHFWQGLSSSSAVVWVDQYKNSPALFRLLLSVKDDSKKQFLDDLLRWTGPFVSSLRPTNQVSACRVLLGMLFEDLQRDRYSTIVRTQCYMAGLQALMTALRHLTTDKIPPNTRSAITDTLDLVSKYAKTIVSFVTRPQSQLAAPAGEVVRLALALECQCLVCDHELLVDEDNFRQGSFALHSDIWREAVNQVQKDHTALASNILAGAKNLVGLEKFVAKQNGALGPSLEHFNRVFDAVNGYVSDTLDRAAEFDAADASKLFDDPIKMNACVGQLASSDPAVRTATLELLKAAQGETVRRDTVRSLMNSEYFAIFLNACSTSLRRLAYLRTFVPSPFMLTLCKDILDVLCDSSDGILRDGSIHEPGIKAIEGFWGAIWLELQTIFTSTESWSNMGHDKNNMMKFCGDVMEFAGLVFDQSPIFASAIDVTAQPSEGRLTGAGKRLTEDPKTTLPVMLRFLRLRDEFLLRKSTALVCDVLLRLKRFETAVDASALGVLGEMLKGNTRTVLSITQKAELQRALETHTGQPFAIEPDADRPKAAKEVHMKSTVIDLEKWKAKADSGPRPGNLQSTIASASQAADEFKRRQQQQQTNKPPRSATPAAPVVPATAKPAVDPIEFGKKRQEEIAAKRRRDAEAAAKARRGFASNEVDAFTAGQGSGIASLGVSGKDHSVPKGQGMMVSSDESESEDSETEFDRELFGGPQKSKKTLEDIRAINEDKARRRAMVKQQQGPVKKQRLVRSAKDMRARLAPDLAPLHKVLLGWDFNHVGTLPPKANAGDYAAVLSQFRSPVDYQNTFQPLLTLEAWNGFLKAKEDNATRSFEIKIINRSSVDAFLEVGASIDRHAANEIGEGDLILVSKDAISNNTASSVHCLSRVQRMTRKKTHVEVLFRIIPGTQIVQSLKANKMVYGLKIMSLVPLEREYGALLGLQYYDLCDEITKAKPSPLLNYADERLLPYQNNYKLNKAQAKAVRSAIDNDAFTLVQGPPGSGKTKTIVAIVGALLTDLLRNPTGPVVARRSEFIANRPPSKKMLVCAPSNAAVDELIMRFKEGVKLTSGEHRKVGIVRLGRSDAINANVQDVTLDELVNKKLNLTSGNAKKDDTHKLMQEHKEISDRLREARAVLDKTDNPETRKAVQDLSRSKATFSQRIDKAKDDESIHSRQADLNRRRAQQDVIEEAQIICATLSGSGHDMFQNLNVEFETVVIDEAAQCVELSALIPLKYGCAKCVLVGDPQQLPPTVFSKQAASMKYEQSLFVRMQSNHPDHVHLLDTQYRMHPIISAFPSQTFYDGRLLDGPDMAKLRTRAWHAAELLGPYQFFDVKGQHQFAAGSHSLVNFAEVKVAIQLYRRLITDFKQDFRGKIGVITPYKSQLRELKLQFGDAFGARITEDIEFNTTDAFQGRESEIIIFSCVRASPSGGIGFLQDIRRMNVGLTRAKSSLWVLGNGQSLMKGEYWRKLVEHSKSSGSFFQGDVSSVLSRPLRITKKLEALPDPGGEPTMPPPVTRSDSSDAMEIDRPSSRPSLNAAVPSRPLQPLKPLPQPLSDKPSVPAKRKLSDSRPSSSSSMTSDLSHTSTSSTSTTTAVAARAPPAPPSHKAARASPAPAAPPPRNHGPHATARPRTDSGSASDAPPQKKPAVPPGAAPRPAATPIVRRKKPTSIFATDPTKKRR